MLDPMSKTAPFLLLAWAVFLLGCDRANPLPRDGSAERPLVVLLVPAESGRTNLLDDYRPLMSAVTRVYKIHFDMRMASSYATVVEGMKAGQVDIAHFGAVSYRMARDAQAAELLGVAVENGQAVYYAGIFARQDSGINSINDLRGRTLATGDPNSTSSFNYPVAMLIDAGIDPARDLRIVLAGSHSASLTALEAGQVDAAAASINAYEKMLREGSLDGSQLKEIARSEPIPNPPLAMWTGLEPQLKTTLRNAFGSIHTQPGVNPEMILGYGGKVADRYDTSINDGFIEPALTRLATVTDELKADIVRAASAPRPPSP